MTCQDLAALVTDHLEGSLSLREEVSFQVHLGICKHCRAWLKQMRGMVNALGKLEEPLPAAPPQVQQELLARFRSFKRGK